MAIQHRRGADKDFDASKMLPGEIAVTTDGTRKVYAAFAAGDAKELASKEDVDEAITDGIASIEEKELEAIKKINTGVEEVRTAGENQTNEINSAGTLQTNAVNEAAKKAMENIGNGVDDTLSTEGKAADAAAAGEAIRKVNTAINNVKSYIVATSRPTTWQEVAKAVSTRLAPEIYAIGDEFTNTWKDTVANVVYDNPLRVNHFSDGELEDGTVIPGMWLQTHYAQLKGVQFSHQRAFLACSDGLAAGTYYFTIESAWGNNVSAGDIVCFTVTKEVPVGGRVSGCYGAPDQAKSNWRIYTHSADGKTVLETVTPTFEASGTNLGTQKFNTRNGSLNSLQEMAYGWDRWKTSAMRQYLNSDKPKGEWWTAQDEWDIAPDQLASIDGHLCGVDPELLAVIQPVKTVTYANTVNDGGVADVTYDKVILPSLEQMYINPQVSGEGEYHQYYKELNGTDTKFQQYQTYPVLIHYAIENHASAQAVRLRSAYRGYACYAWGVHSSGHVNSSSAAYASRPAPLVFIGENP